jgi:hypothetical protein
MRANVMDVDQLPMKGVGLGDNMPIPSQFPTDMYAAYNPNSIQNCTVGT